MAPKRRTDPDDGQAYTFQELADFYAGKYTAPEIRKYWDTVCTPLDGGGEPAAAAKTKAKAKVRAKAEPKGAAGAGGAPPGRALPSAEELTKRMKECYALPILSMRDAAHAAPLCQAFKEGGISVVEVVFRTPCAADAIREARKAVEDLYIGAGTILTPQQVDEALDAGADFILSPGFDAGVARRCRARNALYIPGVATPTEVSNAYVKFKLKFLKFFPADVMTLPMLKTFKSVFPEVMFLPTGGMNGSTFTSALKHDNVFAAGGSWLAEAKQVEQAAETGDWSHFKRMAEQTIAAASSAGPQ